jgi:hypothetical protein
MVGNGDERFSNREMLYGDVEHCSAEMNTLSSEIGVRRFLL